MIRKTRSLCIPVLVALALSPGLLAQQPQKWVEVRSPHSVVVSDAGERQARRVAEEFEQFRAVFQAAIPGAKVDPGRPVVIFAVREEKGMRLLLPGFWEQAGQVQPSGIFAAGEVRHYAAVQINAPGGNPNHNIYHEYVHLLNRLNFGQLPAWVNEGLAEVYATTSIGSHTVELGRPDDAHLRLLRREQLLPLETLFTVDHSSPYYNEADKASIFYAQSWALTHLLLFGDESRRGQLESYLRRAASKPPALAAAGNVFGRLKSLERQLQNYCRQPAFRPVTLPAPPTEDSKNYASRELSEAETLSLHGDFFLQTHRPAEARAALEEAIHLDPRQSMALEALGQLALQEDHRSDALQWFGRAVQVASNSYLAHYYYAILLSQQGGGPEETEVVEDHLAKSVELNPAFAAAHAALSNFYAARPSMLEEALDHARKAVALEPEESDYLLNAARILLHARRVDEALTTGLRALELSQTEAERAAGETFLGAARKYQQDLIAWKKAEEDARAAAEERRKRQETGPAVQAAQPAAPEPALPTQPQWGAGPARRVTGSAVEGYLRSVTCKDNAMDVRIDIGAYWLQLHSSDYFNMGLLTAGWKPPEDFDPCKHLKGRRAVIIYRAVEGKPYAGEILAIQIQK